MNRSALGLAILSIVTTCCSFAALPGSTDPALINIPQLTGGYILGGNVIFLNHSPSNGDLDFLSVNTNIKDDLFSTLRDVNLGYDWGFGAKIGYVFANTGNDINLSYLYLDSNSSNLVTLPNNGTLTEINDFTPVTSNGVLITDENATGEHRITQVDLTGGQYINVGCRLILHALAGWRYADVQRFYTLTQGAAAILTTPNTVFDIVNISLIEQDSDFRGTGPLMGMDASYYLGKGFGVTSHGDVAMLIGGVGPTTNVGSLNFITNESTGDVEGAFNGFVFKENSVMHIVPVTDLKLGLDYTYTINNFNDSILTIEMGYQASEYFNVFDRLSTNSDIVFTQILKKSTSDLGFDGPYLTLTYHA